MLRPNIDIKRRITPNSSLIGFFVSFFIVFFSSSGAFFFLPIILKRLPQDQTKVMEAIATTSGEVLGLEESPTPSPTSTPTPSPSPTASPQNPSSQSPSNPGSSYSPPAPTQPTYSGPPLTPAPSQKTLLTLDFEPGSAIGGGWVIDQNEGTTPVLGTGGGQGLSFGPGKLVLKGGETFANSGTLSFWLKIESSLSFGEAPIIAWNFDGESYSYLFTVSVSYEDLGFTLYNDKQGADDINGKLGAPFDWHYVVITWDLTKEPYRRILYIDSKKVSEGEFPFVPLTRNPSLFQIGGPLDDQSSIPFIIDEVVLTNWAKSGEEIVANY